MMSSTTRTWRPVELGVEVLDDAHHARGLGGAAVGGDRHEVDVDRQLDGPAEVAHEEHGALEDRHQQRRVLGVVGGDLGTELGHPGGEALGVDQHRAHVGRGPRRDARSGLVVGHRGDITGRRPVRPGDGRRSGAPGGPRRARCPPPSPAARPAPARPRPATGGARRRPAVPPPGREPPRAATAHGPRARAAATRPGVGRVGHRSARQRVEQRHLVAQHAGLAGQQRAPGRARPPRRTAAAARGAPGCAGSAGSSLLASRTGSGRARRRAAWVSCRRRPSSGWRGPGAMPASPSEPAPRSRLHQDGLGLVVHGVPGGHVGGQHGEAGRPGPGLEVGPGRHLTRAAREAGARTGGGRRHHLGLGRRAGRSRGPRGRR